MATHRFETMLSCSTATPGRGQNVGNNDVAQVTAEMPATTIPSERRREVRRAYRRRCSYEMLESIEEDSVVTRQGEVFALNRSKEGMLLLMGQAPHKKQLIEVHSPCSRSGQAVNVFETKWAKPLPVESLGNLYLIGCRRIFGPLAVSAVQQAAE
ncbi:MAG: hypothetical protein JW395_0862 [Nitrospira sp.]|nr:hypothetical protein [Nitrospira sp.]